MSRSGYSEDLNEWSLIRWRGAVASAIRGHRGQTFLTELLAALDTLPTKRLIRNDLEVAGEVCAIGALGKARSLDMTIIDPEDPPQVAAAFGIAEALAQEIEYMNDEYTHVNETPEERYERMRRWIIANIKDNPS